MSQVTNTTKPANAPKSRKAKAQPTQAAAKPTSALSASLAAIVAAPAPVAAPKKRSTPDLTLVIAKEFKPRTNNTGEEGAKGKWPQISCWNALVRAIQAHGGKITYAEAMAAVESDANNSGYTTKNVRGFVQARVRNGHLVAA
jgi:hypothetical protein